MEEEKSLTEVKHNRKGIRKMINNVVEIIKSKLNKDYILSEKSPESLRRNKDLIIKTIKNHSCYWLDQVPDDILLEELQQDSLPIDGIIYTAFKHGYFLNQSSGKATILLGTEAKKGILQYLEMQEGDNIQFKLDGALCDFDKNLLEDTDFKEKLLELAIKKGYKITRYSRAYLKQNGILAENYYKDLLEKEGQISYWDNILNPELIKNKSEYEKSIILGKISKKINLIFKKEKNK